MVLVVVPGVLFVHTGYLTLRVLETGPEEGAWDVKERHFGGLGGRKRHEPQRLPLGLG